MINTNIVNKWNYGHYSSDNYGSHSLAFTDKFNNTYYFSYDTLVAFTGNDGLVIRENVWGNTTGKHLNWIDNGNKKERLTPEDFEKKYIECFGVPMKPDLEVANA